MSHSYWPILIFNDLIYHVHNLNIMFSIFRLNKVSALCLEGSEEHLLIGTEGGNVYLLNLSTFEMSYIVIYQDVVMQK